jgi:hypothetical protein
MVIGPVCLPLGIVCAIADDDDGVDIVDEDVIHDQVG